MTITFQQQDSPITETTMSSNSYQTFPTRREAAMAMANLMGWPNARPERLYLPDDQNADSQGNVWVIRLADNPLYLRADGYARE